MRRTAEGGRWGRRDVGATSRPWLALVGQLDAKGLGGLVGLSPSSWRGRVNMAFWGGDLGVKPRVIWICVVLVLE